MITAAILQPGYIPWLGFFDQIIRSDIFIYYDDVQFDKHGWRNRNRIKSPEGPFWLTVPILTKGRFGQTNLEVEIDNRQLWARKHIASVIHFYAKAPYLNKYLPELTELLYSGWESLVELDIAIIKLFCEWLSIKKKILRSSDLKITGDKSERLVKICKFCGVKNYLSGDSAGAYLDVSLFAKNNISIEWQKYWHPVYRQMHGEFIPNLSVLDLLLNMGEKSGELITNRVT